jgi:serine/threonine protein kinase
MVMEYLDGGDLAAWLHERGPLPVEQAVEFVLQACEAIAEAHALGIVHRDLKPANLFCVRRADGRLSIKVLDFGISSGSAEAQFLPIRWVTSPVSRFLARPILLTLPALRSRSSASGFATGKTSPPSSIRMRKMPGFHEAGATCRPHASPWRRMDSSKTAPSGSSGRSVASEGPELRRGSNAPPSHLRHPTGCRASSRGKVHRRSARVGARCDSRRSS